jgi:hypothetical protein
VALASGCPRRALRQLHNEALAARAHNADAQLLALCSDKVLKFSAGGVVVTEAKSERMISSIAASPINCVMSSSEGVCLDAAALSSARDMATLALELATRALRP